MFLFFSFVANAQNGRIKVVKDSAAVTIFGTWKFLDSNLPEQKHPLLVSVFQLSLPNTSAEVLIKDTVRGSFKYNTKYNRLVFHNRSNKTGYLLDNLEFKVEKLTKNELVLAMGEKLEYKLYYTRSYRKIDQQ